MFHRDQFWDQCMHDFTLTIGWLELDGISLKLLKHSCPYNLFESNFKFLYLLFLLCLEFRWIPFLALYFIRFILVNRNRFFYSLYWCYLENAFYSLILKNLIFCVHKNIYKIINFLSGVIKLTSKLRKFIRLFFLLEITHRNYIRQSIPSHPRHGIFPPQTAPPPFLDAIRDVVGSGQNVRPVSPVQLPHAPGYLRHCPPVARLLVFILKSTVSPEGCDKNKLTNIIHYLKGIRVVSFSHFFPSYRKIVSFHLLDASWNLHRGRLGIKGGMRGTKKKF